jgi:hypothetical protein
LPPIIWFLGCKEFFVISFRSGSRSRLLRIHREIAHPGSSNSSRRIATRPYAAESIVPWIVAVARVYFECGSAPAQPVALESPSKQIFFVPDPWRGEFNMFGINRNVDS